MIDFETFSKKGQPGYLALLKELSDDLHAKDMKLYVSVQARNTSTITPRVAAHADGVVLMNYDEHYPAPGLAGPVASQDWFTDNLKAAVKVIPKDKLISAIGNYGYDWVKKPKGGSLPPGVKDTNVACRMPGWQRVIRKPTLILTAIASIRTSPTWTSTTCSTTSGFSMP